MVARSGGTLAEKLNINDTHIMEDCRVEMEDTIYVG